METVFEFYDNWNGLLTFLGGVYATLLAFEYLPRKPKDPAKLAIWRRKFGPTMKVLGPLVMLFGLVTLVSALLKDDSLAARVQEINRSAPKMVDQITRFDRAIGGPGQRIAFEHTVTTIKASQISVDAWVKFARELRKNVFSAEVRKFQRRRVTLVYRYSDTDGHLIGEMEISPDDVPPK